jgi:hypothetical protein
MTENKDEDYYLNLLKERGLNTEKLNAGRLSPSYTDQHFANDKIFMNWLIGEDYSDFNTIKNKLFSIYSNPSSEDDIVINKYISSSKKSDDFSNLIDECTESSIYTLSILFSIQNYSTDDLIKIHNKIFEDLIEIKKKTYDIIEGALKNLGEAKNKNQEKSTERNNKKENEHYIG